VTTIVTRIGSAFHVPQVWAWLILVVGLAGLVAGVAVATSLQRLPLSLGLGVLGLVTMLSFRWPILGLCVFTALIPIEGLLLIDGLGTITRFAGILFAVSYGLPRLGRLTAAPLPIAGWAFLAWACLSIGWARDAFTTGSHLVTLLQLFLIAVLIADFVVRRPEIIRPVMWVYGVSASATAVVSFLSYLGSASRSAAIEDQDPNLFAAALLPALIFGLHELVSGRRKVPGAVIAILTTIGVVDSGSRGAWVAGAVAIAVFLLPKLGVRRRLVATASVALIAALVLQVPGIADLLADRAGSALETGGAGRTDIWRVAQTIYAADPVLGVGYANFPVAYTSEAVRATGVQILTETGRAPHNIAVGTLIELGPFGLLLLALFLGPLLFRRLAGPEAIPVQAGLAALIVLAFFLGLFGQSKTLWLMIGLTAGLAHIRRQGGPDLTTEANANRRDRQREASALAS
jgi:O-antigen ligase